MKTIKNLENLFKDSSLNSVLTAISGLRDQKAAITWHADVATIFAIDVAENTVLVNVDE
jgi:hypothetical protein